MATKRKDEGGSAAEQKGGTPRLPDDSRDFAESHGDTDLEEPIEQSRRLPAELDGDDDED